MRYGPFYPSLVVSEPYQPGDVVWKNPGNAAGLPNSDAATSNVPIDGYSAFLKANGFGANIPAGKTILEVGVELPGMLQGGNLFSYSDQWMVGPLGDQQAYTAPPYIRVESDYVSGLTPAVVNDPSFGFKFAVSNSGGVGPFPFAVESLAMHVEAV